MTTMKAPGPGTCLVRAAMVVSTLALLSGCKTIGPPGPKVAITPMCTLLAESQSSATISWNGQVLVSERTDLAADPGFTPFRTMAGPRGNPTIGFTNPTGVPDTYGISEAWLRWPGAAEVHRAQATPASRTTAQGTDTFGGAWNLSAQDPSGAWSGVFGTGSASRPAEAEVPESGAETVPRLMPVGLAVPQMFACAGGRSEDGAERTTWLVESVAPSTARGASGGVQFIQDLLNGDDRFVPNAPGPLIGPAAPPTPSISGPGNPIRSGSVKCAMTQLDDDVATRALHLVSIANGTLYHAMASDFGPVTSGSGSTFSRFRAVSGWSDVGQVLGGGFGQVVSAAVVAQPAAIHVFFMAEAGSGRYRLFHTVRFASGAWRPVKDVLALSGDAPNGTVYPFKVAAGRCPEPGASTWDASTTEIVLALWGGSSPFNVDVIRVVSTPRFWQAGVNGDYSPLRSVPPGALASPVSLRSVVVTARPFRDSDRAPP